MTNGFALNNELSLQVYFFCVKCQAKNDFLKDVESAVGTFCNLNTVVLFGDYDLLFMVQ